MALETKQRMEIIKCWLELLLNEKSTAVALIHFLSTPTHVEVDRLPSGSITLDKDSVGVHEQLLFFIYLNPAVDDNTSTLVLICNITSQRSTDQKKKKAMKYYITFTQADPKRSF